MGVEIPKRRLTVFTGVSGSGKSSLVVNTIAAESQSLINETCSAFVQGFMPALARPDVDVLEGLTTAIIVDRTIAWGQELLALPSEQASDQRTTQTDQQLPQVLRSTPTGSPTTAATPPKGPCNMTRHRRQNAKPVFSCSLTILARMLLTPFVMSSAFRSYLHLPGLLIDAASDC